jgi:hypothetical protein
MKHRHNKKRNTAILYETLIRELTRSSIRENKKCKNKIMKLLKEHFNKNSILAYELELYNILNERGGFKKEIAEKILNEAKSKHAKLNRKAIFKEQSKLIKNINYQVGQDLWENYVSSFKDFASIYQIFYDTASAKQKIFLEEQTIEKMTLPPLAKEEKYGAINNLAFKTFLEKFNEKYSNKLLKEQKELLSLYATSFNKSDLELKIFLNEEISRLRDTIENDTKSTLEESNKEQLLKLLKSFSGMPIGKMMLEKVLKIQKLTNEMSNYGN